MEITDFIRSGEFRKYKAGIFDLDNTLYAYPPCNKAGMAALHKAIATDFVRTEAQVAGAYDEARKQVHHRLKGTAAMHSRLLYIQGTLEKLGINPWQSGLLRYNAVFWDAYFQVMEITPWVREAFDALHEAGMKIGILTDFTTEMQVLKLQRLGLDTDVDHLVSSEEAGIEKPDTRGLLLLLQKMQLTAGEVFYVGDDEVKDRLGEPLGIKTLIVS